MSINFYKIHLGILFCFFSLNLLAQLDNKTQVKKHRFSIYGGVGLNYYFNNLVICKDCVLPWNYSLAARLMWEPGNFFSLGFETGYYQLYTVKYTTPSFETAQITNITIPIQLVVSMKFLKNYYADLSIGQTNLLYKFSSSDIESFDYSSWSLADYGLTVGYKRLFIGRVSTGAEIKFFHSEKNNDSNLAFVFMVGYNF